ncbi:MAG: hypothetical protein ACHREM_23425, partial [Polyangiales bacterium]
LGVGHDYVLDGSSGVVSLASIGLGGALAVPATPTPLTLAGRSAAFAHPSGAWLFTVSTDPSSTAAMVSAYAVDPATGAISATSAGSYVTTLLGYSTKAGLSPPRAAFDPLGRFVAVSAQVLAGAGGLAVVSIDVTGGAHPVLAGFDDANEPESWEVCAIDPLGRYVMLARSPFFLHGVPVDPSTFAPIDVPHAAYDAGPSFTMVVSHEIVLSPDGTHGIVGGGSNTIALLDIDPTTALYSAHDALAIVADATAIVSGVVFDPVLPLVYIAEGATPALHVYKLDPTSATGLTSVGTAPCPTSPGALLVSAYGPPPAK